MGDDDAPARKRVAKMKNGMFERCGIQDGCDAKDRCSADGTCHYTGSPLSYPRMNEQTTVSAKVPSQDNVYLDQSRIAAALEARGAVSTKDDCDDKCSRIAGSCYDCPYIITIASIRRMLQPTATTSHSKPSNPKDAMTDDSEARKAMPIATGVLDYFPDALADVARLSKIGNDKHNPGEPMHWARGKSMDQADCILRHMVDRGTIDTDGVLHDTKVAWRALAQLQLTIEALRAEGRY